MIEPVIVLNLFSVSDFTLDVCAKVIIEEVFELIDQYINTYVIFSIIVRPSTCVFEVPREIFCNNPTYC